MRFPLFATIAIAVLWAGAPAASEEQAVIRTVQRLFDAMEARDAAAARAVLAPKGSLFSVREKGGEASVSGQSLEEFAARLADGKEAIREEMHDPKVLIHGRIASVWTPYRFYRGGKLSHCGIDAFNLVKTAEGWKIASLIYNVEPCR